MFPVVSPPRTRGENVVDWIVPVPALKVRDPETEAVPAISRSPVGEMLLAAEKKSIFPWDPLVVETKVRVPPAPVPPLIVEFPPRVKVVVEPMEREAAVVKVARPEAVRVVSEGSIVMVLLSELRVSPAPPPEERVTAPSPE